MATGSERKCTDCGGTDFIVIHSLGDITCKNCGMVAEAHIIDERSEWRTFSDKDKDSEDPNRVGGPGNPLLDGGGMSTMIGKGKDGDGSHALNRTHMRSNNPNRALNAAFGKLADMCQHLSISTNTKDIACEIYKKAADSGRLKGRSTTAICAACTYLACRQTGKPRSFKEITAIMPTEVAKKDISRCFKEIMELMKQSGSARSMPSATAGQQPVDYVQRYAKSLQLSYDTRKLCLEMAQNARAKDNSDVHPWDSRSPVSIAAAIIFIVTVLKEPTPLQDIVLYTQVTETTIRIVYKEMYPSLRKLLPPELATPSQLTKLQIPETRTPSGASVPLKME